MYKTLPSSAIFCLALIFGLLFSIEKGSADNLSVPGDWKPNLGGEYSMKYGSPLGVVTSARRNGTDVVRVDYSFNTGGRYVGALASVNIAKAKSIKFSVYSDSPIEVLEFRMEDSKKQFFGQFVKYSHPGQWQDYVIVLSTDLPELRHWKGSADAPGDGFIYFPITTLIFDIDVETTKSRSGSFEVGKIQAVP